MTTETFIDAMGRTRTRTPSIERVLAKVERAGDCLIFTGHTNRKGYGPVSPGPDGESLAHRIVYAHAAGPIPGGLLVRHSCDTPACVERQHLALGTAADNSADMVGRGRSPRSTNEKSGKAKLTDSQVAAIRSLSKEGLTRVELGRRFGVHAAHIGRIVNLRRRPVAA